MIERNRFTGIEAKSYLFHGKEGDRYLIALYSGSRQVGFIEYNVARAFVDRIHDLCDLQEARDRRQIAEQQTLQQTPRQHLAILQAVARPGQQRPPIPSSNTAEANQSHERTQQ